MIIISVFLISWIIVFIGFPFVSYIKNKIKLHKVNKKCPICGCLYKLKYSNPDTYYGGLSLYKKVDCYVCSNPSCDNYHEHIYVEYDMDINLLSSVSILTLLFILPMLLILVIL